MHERTEEERERAREERARRRASRSGVDQAGDPPEVARPAEQRRAVSAPIEEPLEMSPTVEPPDAHVDPDAFSSGRPSPAPLEDEHAEPPSASSVESPPPPIPAQLSQASIAHSTSPPAAAGAPPPKERSGVPGRSGGGRSLAARAGALLALGAAAVAVWLLLQSLLGSGHSSTVAHAAIVKVVIPEGKTRLQIAQIAAGDGLTGSYRAASRRSRLLDPTHYGAPRGTPDLEGFLFPATYDMNPGAHVSQLVDEQLLAFRQRFGASEIRRARELHVTAYELLTVASMVEREAQTNHDRPLIAAVIYNRLRQGMALGIDASIYYAVELQKGIATYTHELTQAQLRIASPYNTRIHTGLPPTPISNPGLASIAAAAHPAHVSFLYYVLAADGCGEHTFSTTYAQFERDAAAYRAAVTKNGGRPPTCKGK